MQWQFYTTSHDAWVAMQASLRSAKRSIYLESYIFLDDEIGHEFVDILVQKAQQGLDVRLILDGIGSWGFSVRSVRRLQDAGARVLSFQSLAPVRIVKSLRRLFHRNHRKTLIIDRTVGFIGGVNVKKEYASWLDLHLKIESEAAVNPMVHSFAKTWIRGGGKRRHVRDLLAHSTEMLRRKIRHLSYVFDRPVARFKERGVVRRLYIHAVHTAKRHIVIATPYFLPDKKLLAAFQQARQRGVQIELLIPLHADIRILNYALHGMFSVMHAMGAQLYVLPEMMHGKALVVDGEWGMVGSSNIDARSFFYNHEANVRFSNRTMVRDLLSILYTWRAQARTFDAIRWGRRSLWRKFCERMVGLVSPIL